MPRSFAVYAVGGPVRDWLLERGIADVDLIVEPRDGEGAEALGRAVAPDARAPAQSRSLRHAEPRGDRRA